MRLLNTETLALKEFYGADIPTYVILSHVHGPDEETYARFATGKPSDSAGYKKVINFCAFALKEGWNWVWIDTCCVDRASTAEISEAINSAYRWYRDAAVCYALLSDIPELPSESTDSNYTFTTSQWFTRGWTLVELVAPAIVIFLNNDWNIIGYKGHRTALAETDLTADVSSLTNIPSNYLHDASLLRLVQPAKIFDWACGRQVTRIEDRAYCLLGLLDLSMPILYGEGSRAFDRLEDEIHNQKTRIEGRRDSRGIFSRRTRRNHDREPLGRSSAIQDPYLILPEASPAEEMPEFMRAFLEPKSPLDDLVIPGDTHTAATVTSETPRVLETLHVEPASVQTRTTWSTCWTIITLATMIVALSFSVGLYYSIARDQMGDGFTLAGWIIAVGTLGLAVPITQHYPHCRCWKKSKPETLASA